MKIFQHYILPVVRVTRTDSEIRYERLHGTAFSINYDGTFITAAHVLDEAQKEAMDLGGEIGLMVRKPDDNKSYIANITTWEKAPEPYDIAIGLVDKPTQSCFALANTSRVWAWEDIYAAGYAESAVSRQGDQVRADIRSLKGYVVRKLQAGEYLSKPGLHPDAFEVSFSIPHCMSGSPLVMRYEAGEVPPPGAPFPLLGVCVGTETVRVGNSVENYGVVHDLSSLADWQPICLSSKPLADAIRPQLVNVVD